MLMSAVLVVTEGHAEDKESVLQPDATMVSPDPDATRGHIDVDDLCWHLSPW